MVNVVTCLLMSVLDERFPFYAAAILRMLLQRHLCCMFPPNKAKKTHAFVTA